MGGSSWKAKPRSLLLFKDESNSCANVIHKRCAAGSLLMHSQRSSKSRFFHEVPVVTDCHLTIKQSPVGSISASNLSMSSSPASIVTRMVGERLPTGFRSVPVWLPNASHLVSIDSRLVSDGLSVPFERVRARSTLRSVGGRQKNLKFVFSYVERRTFF